MQEFIFYNANPEKKRKGDCTVRAISKALCQSWQRTYIELCFEGFLMFDMPSSNKVWSDYLRRKGFTRKLVSAECEDCYTVRDFCREYPHGTYVLALGEYVVAVIDGDYYDTWDSGDETPIYFFEREER